ncbi:MAG: hypothetical protein E6R09_05190 [Rhodocyclaceae bacterium]|nr:MAG: hypothetical protein E6R09_05190 [Rhodocyclaceae bacterium]
MVGDTCDADVAGPINAGLQAIWLRRNNAPSDEWISNLNQVMARISGEKYPDQEYAHCPCPAAQVYSPINNENRRPARVIACSRKYRLQAWTKNNSANETSAPNLSPRRLLRLAGILKARCAKRSI